MNWKILKDFWCPSCESSQLRESFVRKGYLCEVCKFFIGKDKFNKIVSGVPQQVEKPDVYQPKDITK